MHSITVGYHCFGGLCCLHLQAEVKCWYPTTSLRHHNPEDHDLIFITVKNLNLTSLKLYTGRKNTSLSSKEEMGSWSWNIMLRSPISVLLHHYVLVLESSIEIIYQYFQNSLLICRFETSVQTCRAFLLATLQPTNVTYIICTMPSSIQLLRWKCHILSLWDYSFFLCTNQNLYFEAVTVTNQENDCLVQWWFHSGYTRTQQSHFYRH